MKRIIFALLLAFVSVSLFSQTTVGTQVTSGIVPNDSSDNYPSHFSYFGKGGLRTVADTIERNAIFSARRELGMIVYVQAEDKFYILKTGLANSDWEEFIIAGATNADTSLYAYELLRESELVSRTIYVDSATGNDVTGDGTLLLPYETIGRALDDIKYYIVGVTITIQLGEGTYDYISTDVVSMYDHYCINVLLPIILKGTYTITESALTVTALTGDNKCKYIVSGKSWSLNQYKRYIISNSSWDYGYPIYYNNIDTIIIPYYNRIGLNEIRELKTVLNIESEGYAVSFSSDFDGIIGKPSKLQLMYLKLSTTQLMVAYQNPYSLQNCYIYSTANYFGDFGASLLLYNYFETNYSGSTVGYGGIYASGGTFNGNILENRAGRYGSALNLNSNSNRTINGMLIAGYKNAITQVFGNYQVTPQSTNNIYVIGTENVIGRSTSNSLDFNFYPGTKFILANVDYLFNFNIGENAVDIHNLEYVDETSSLISDFNPASTIQEYVNVGKNISIEVVNNGFQTNLTDTTFIFRDSIVNYVMQGVLPDTNWVHSKIANKDSVVHAVHSDTTSHYDVPIFTFFEAEDSVQADSNVNISGNLHIQGELNIYGDGNSSMILVNDTFTIIHGDTLFIMYRNDSIILKSSTGKLYVEGNADTSGYALSGAWNNDIADSIWRIGFGLYEVDKKINLGSASLSTANERTIELGDTNISFVDDENYGTYFKIGKPNFYINYANSDWNRYSIYQQDTSGFQFKQEGDYGDIGFRLGFQDEINLWINKDIGNSFFIQSQYGSGYTTIGGDGDVEFYAQDTLNQFYYKIFNDTIIKILKSGLKYGDDYSDRWTTDRYIPDIGKVKSLINDTADAVRGEIASLIPDSAAFSDSTLFAWYSDSTDYADTSGYALSGAWIGNYMDIATYDPEEVAGDVFDCSNTAYDNGTSGIASDNVQDAIDEVYDSLGLYQKADEDIYIFGAGLTNTAGTVTLGDTDTTEYGRSFHIKEYASSGDYIDIEYFFDFETRPYFNIETKYGSILNSYKIEGQDGHYFKYNNSNILTMNGTTANFYINLESSGSITATTLYSTDLRTNRIFSSTDSVIIDDNLHVAGNGTVTGDLTVEGKITTEKINNNSPHLYAGFADSTTVIACTQDVWAHISNSGDSLFRYIEVDEFTVFDDTITIQDAGDYEIYFNLSFSGNNGEDWKIRTVKLSGATETTVGFNSERYTSNNDIGNVSNNVYGEFLAGDKIYFQIMNTTDSDDATVKSTSVLIKYLHE